MRQRGPGSGTGPRPGRPGAGGVGACHRRAAGGARGPLLPVLHEVVATHGYVHDDDVPVVAEVLNLSRADVHGVVTFYHDLRRTPPAAHRVVAVPRRGLPGAGGREACTPWPPTAGPARPTSRSARSSASGCAPSGPSGTVDGTLHAGLSPERLDALTEGWRR